MEPAFFAAGYRIWLALVPTASRDIAHRDWMTLVPTIDLAGLGQGVRYQALKPLGYVLVNSIESNPLSNK